MPTTATAPEIALWRQQTFAAGRVVAINVGGLTHQDSLVEPQPGGNRLNWIVGHLLWAYHEVMPLLGQEPVMDPALLKRYARGARPLTDPAQALDFQQMVDAWQVAVERVDAGLAKLAPEVLDRPAPSSPAGNPDETIRTLLTTMMFHQAYHAGQTAVLRRIAGKEGAIK